MKKFVFYMFFLMAFLLPLKYNQNYTNFSNIITTNTVKASDYCDANEQCYTMGSIDLSSAIGVESSCENGGAGGVCELYATSGTVLVYDNLNGSSGDDNIEINGKFVIDSIDLGDGNNSITMDEGSELREGDSPTSYKNINTFTANPDVVIDRLDLAYNSKDMYINLNATGDKPIEIGDFLLISPSYSTNAVGYINITGKVIFDDDVILSQQAEVITLNSNSEISSTIEIDLGQGNDQLILNEGTTVTANDLEMQEGDDTILIKGNATITSSIDTGDGNDTFSVQNSSGTNINVNLDQGIIGFGAGNDTVSIGDYVTLSVANALNTGDDNDTIIIGEHSEVDAPQDIDLDNGNDTMEIKSYSRVNGNITLGSGDDTFIVDTTNDTNTYTVESLDGEAGNDTIVIQGDTSSNIAFTSISNIENINLGGSSVTFTSYYIQNTDLNLTISLDSDIDSSTARMVLGSSANFDGHNMNIYYTDLTSNVKNIGDTYTLTVFSVGDPASDYFDSYGDIGLNLVHSDSSIYDISYTIVDDSLQANITKCSTFSDVVSGNSGCASSSYYQGTDKKYLISIANYLDEEMQKDDLSDSMQAVLDELAQETPEELTNSLNAFVPIKQELLLTLNKDLGDSFNSVVFDSKPYKINKDSLVSWAQFSFDSFNLEDTLNSPGIKDDVALFMVGIDYNPLDKLKVGIAFGYAYSSLDNKEDLFGGSGNTFDITAYGFYSVTKNIDIRLSAGYENTSYDMSRNNDLVDATSKPKAYQEDVEAMFLYKYKILGDMLLTPFVNVGYIAGTSEGYSETGDYALNVDEAKAQYIKTEFGASILSIMKLDNGMIAVPNAKVSLEKDFGNIDNTDFTFADDVSPEVISISPQYYGDLVLKFQIGINYFINNSNSLEFNIGTTQGSDTHNYDLIVNYKYKI